MEIEDHKSAKELKNDDDVPTLRSLLEKLNIKNIDLNYDQEKEFFQRIENPNLQPYRDKLIEIKELIIKRISLEKYLSQELKNLDKKYDDIYLPFYEDRKKIINGEKEVKYVPNETDVKLYLENPNPIVEEKGIPNYWLRTIRNTKEFYEKINDTDREILKSLQDIRSVNRDDGDFSITFYFGENKYFTNPTLTIDYIVQGNLHCKEIIATVINWKDSKYYQQGSSFFDIFKPLKFNDKVTLNSKLNDSMFEIDDHHELGLFIKDDLIPYSLEYFLDLVEEEEDSDDMINEDEEIEEEENDDEIN